MSESHPGELATCSPLRQRIRKCLRAHQGSWFTESSAKDATRRSTTRRSWNDVCSTGLSPTCHCAFRGGLRKERRLHSVSYVCDRRCTSPRRASDAFTCADSHPATGGGRRPTVGIRFHPAPIVALCPLRNSGYALPLACTYDPGSGGDMSAHQYLTQYLTSHLNAYHGHHLDADVINDSPCSASHRAHTGSCYRIGVCQLVHIPASYAMHRRHTRTKTVTEVLSGTMGSI